MERKRVAAFVVGVVCVTLLAAPVSSAAPQQVSLNPASAWTQWLGEVTSAFKAGWVDLKALAEGKVKDWTTKGETAPEVLQEGGTCSDSLTLKHGCTPDPNG